MASQSLVRNVGGATASARSESMVKMMDGKKQMVHTFMIIDMDFAFHHITLMLAFFFINV